MFSNPSTCRMINLLNRKNKPLSPELEEGLDWKKKIKFQKKSHIMAMFIWVKLIEGMNVL